jgi:mannose-6-phosphate isomerase class I
MGLAILAFLGAAADAIALAAAAKTFKRGKTSQRDKSAEEIATSMAAASQAYRTMCQFRNARKTNKANENSTAEHFNQWMQKMSEFDCSELEDMVRKGLLLGSAEGKIAHHALDQWLQNMDSMREKFISDNMEQSSWFAHPRCHKLNGQLMGEALKRLETARLRPDQEAVGKN